MLLDAFVFRVRFTPQYLLQIEVYHRRLNEPAFKALRVNGFKVRTVEANARRSLILELHMMKRRLNKAVDSRLSFPTINIENPTPILLEMIEDCLSSYNLKCYAIDQLCNDIEQTIDDITVNGIRSYLGD